MPKTNQQKSPWCAPKIWSGDKVFIVGGGPSLRGVDLIPILREIKTIGTNDAFLLGPEAIDVVYFGDNPYGDREYVKCGLKEFGGLVVTCATRHFKYKHIKWMQRGVPVGLDKRPGKVSWNLNTGMSAINLAYHFGVKRVVLLGFDFKRDKDGNKNWHNNHPESHKPPFERWMGCWDRVMKDAARYGLEIVNATIDTDIPTNLVPRVRLEDEL